MNKKTIHKIPVLTDQEDIPTIFVDEFSPETLREFTCNMTMLESNPSVSEIFVYITSLGGDVFHMIAMAETILACSKPVNTVGRGICASAGGIILACGTGTRYLAPNSFLHIHHIRGAIEGDLPDQEQGTEQTKIIEEKMFRLLTDNSKMTVSELKDRLQKEQREWQLSAHQAKKYGFVDKVGIPKFETHMITKYY